MVCRQVYINTSHFVNLFLSFFSIFIGILHVYMLYGQHNRWSINDEDSPLSATLTHGLRQGIVVCKPISRRRKKEKVVLRLQIS